LSRLSRLPALLPTAGHHGFLDAWRGGTTEHVLQRALCPVLAVPADVIPG
jgi:nucleotide-binding universal stress UspA family protein